MSIHRIARSISRGITKNIAKEITGREYYPQTNAASLAEVDSVNPWVSRGTGTFLTNPTDPYSGTYSLRAFSFSINSGGSIDLNPYLTGGTSYNMSFWARHGGTGGSYQYRLGSTTSDLTGQLLTTTTTSTTTWSEVTTSFTFGATNRYLLLNAISSNGSTFIDLISIT